MPSLPMYVIGSDIFLIIVTRDIRVITFDTVYKLDKISRSLMTKGSLAVSDF